MPAGSSVVLSGSRLRIRPGNSSCTSCTVPLPPLALPPVSGSGSGGRSDSASAGGRGEPAAGSGQSPPAASGQRSSSSAAAGTVDSCTGCGSPERCGCQAGRLADSTGRPAGRYAPSGFFWAAASGPPDDHRVLRTGDAGQQLFKFILVLKQLAVVETSLLRVVQGQDRTIE